MAASFHHIQSNYAHMIYWGIIYVNGYNTEIKQHTDNNLTE